MTKLLNLDELASPERHVVFKGNKHEVLELNVGMFVDMQKDLEEVDAAMKRNDTSALMKAGASVIVRSVPTMADDINKLNDRQMVALVQLISNTYPQDDSDPKPEAAVSE